MRYVYRTTLWLFVAGLIVSLGLTGASSVMTVWAANGVRASIPQVSTPCCCGTEDGSCCGMGCCAARQAPEPSPCPANDDGRDGRFNPLASALGKVPFACGNRSEGALFGRFMSDPDRSPAEFSLQARHVRLDA